MAERNPPKVALEAYQRRSEPLDYAVPAFLRTVEQAAQKVDAQVPKIETVRALIKACAKGHLEVDESPGWTHVFGTSFDASAQIKCRSIFSAAEGVLHGKDREKLQERLAERVVEIFKAAAERRAEKEEIRERARYLKAKGADELLPVSTAFKAQLHRWRQVQPDASSVVADVLAGLEKLERQAQTAQKEAA